MKTLYNKEDYQEVISRLNQINPDNSRNWGEMTVSQMMAHCSVSLETATGQLKAKRIFIGRIIGPMFKRKAIAAESFKPGLPTSKEFIVRDDKDFSQEKERLQLLIRKFSDGGPSLCTKNPHAFYGKLTPHEWGVFMYKHLDHHFRQFGA